MFSKLLKKVLRTAKRTFGGKQQKQKQKQSKTMKKRSKAKGG